MAEPFGQAGKVLLFVDKEFEGIVLVQGVVGERDAECGELLVDFTQAGLLVGREVGTGTYKFLVLLLQ